MRALLKILTGPFLVFLISARDVLWIFSRTAITCLKGPYRGKEILHHLHHIGVGSLSVVVISTAFAGIVVSSEIAYHMDLALHTVEMVPGFTAQFIFRELGIVIPSLLLVSKVGASTTAEVGTMKVTEQIDALRLLQIDPIEYLVYPRFIASIVSALSLTLIAIVVTSVGAMTVAVLNYNFSYVEYLNSMQHFITTEDFLYALIKGMCFGAVIPIISCFYGFNCKGGAEGVGTATTNAVVTSTVLIVVIDFILTFAFSQLL